MEIIEMKKLPITKEVFEKSKYFTNKYGKLAYVNESGKMFKTNKGKILMFKEGTESNPRFKCMEGNKYEYEYDDDILEFRKDVINALKRCYGDKYLIEPGTYDKSIYVTDPNIGVDFQLDISVSDKVGW